MLVKVDGDSNSIEKEQVVSPADAAQPTLEPQSEEAKFREPKPVAGRRREGWGCPLASGCGTAAGSAARARVAPGPALAPPPPPRVSDTPRGGGSNALGSG